MKDWLWLALLFVLGLLQNPLFWVCAVFLYATVKVCGAVLYGAATIVGVIDETRTLIGRKLDALIETQRAQRIVAEDEEDDDEEHEEDDDELIEL